MGGRWVCLQKCHRVGMCGEMWEKMGNRVGCLPLKPAVPPPSLSSKKPRETPAHVGGSRSSYVPSSAGTAPGRSKVPSSHSAPLEGSLRFPQRSLFCCSRWSSKVSPSRMIVSRRIHPLGIFSRVLQTFGPMVERRAMWLSVRFIT